MEIGKAMRSRNNLHNSRKQGIRKKGKETTKKNSWPKEEWNEWVKRNNNELYLENRCV